MKQRKKKFHQEGGINQKSNRARQNTRSKETLAANGVFCLGRVPACVQRDFRSHHSVWCSVVSEPPSGFRSRNKTGRFQPSSSKLGLITHQPIATRFADAFGADLDCAEACARSSCRALSEKKSRKTKKTFSHVPWAEIATIRLLLLWGGKWKWLAHELWLRKRPTTEPLWPAEEEEEEEREAGVRGATSVSEEIFSSKSDGKKIKQKVKSLLLLTEKWRDKRRANLLLLLTLQMS